MCKYYTHTAVTALLALAGAARAVLLLIFTNTPPVFTFMRSTVAECFRRFYQQLQVFLSYTANRAVCRTLVVERFRVLGLELENIVLRGKPVFYEQYKFRGTKNSWIPPHGNRSGIFQSPGLVFRVSSLFKLCK